MTGDQEGGAALGQGVEGGPQLLAGDRVQADGRLVHDEQVRVGHERAGQDHAPGLAAGVGGHGPVGQGGEPDDVENLVQVTGPAAGQGGEVAQVLAGGQVSVDGLSLGDVADPTAHGGSTGGVPENLDLPAVALDADDGAHEGGLAAARGAEQAGDGAGLQVQVQAVEDLLAPTGHAQVRRGDGRLLRGGGGRDVSTGVVRLVAGPRLPGRVSFIAFHHVMNIGRR